MTDEEKQTPPADEDKATPSADEAKEPEATSKEKGDLVIKGDAINKGCGLCCSYFIPPLGIFFRFGCGVEFLICLILTFCGYFPGVAYACIMIATDKSDD